MAVNPIPERYCAAIPYLNVPDGDVALDFCERAFGARIETRLSRPDGKLAHAEVRVGEALAMVRDFVKDETVVLEAGEQYLAKAPIPRLDPDVWR